MKAINYLSKNQKETVSLGRRLSGCLKKGDIVCLFGDLGSGKTTLTKGIAQGLKIDKDKVHSPSFVLLNIYEGKLSLFHFDFYRIENPKELFSIGYEEYLYDNGVSVIEWAERLGGLIPKDHLAIKLSFKKNNERSIQLSAKGLRAQNILKQLKK